MVGGAVITCACFLALQICLIHAGSRDYDEGVYWQSIRAMLRGEPLFRSVFAPQPPAFYFALIPFYLLSHSLAALRVAVLLFAIIGATGIYLAGRVLAGSVAGLVAAILLLTSPLYIKEAATAQADMPAVATMVVAVAIIILATRREGGRSSILAAAAGLAFAAALGMKLLAAVAIIPLLLYLVLPRRQPVRVLWAFVAGTLVGLVVVLIPAFASLGRAYDDLVASHVIAGRAIHAGVTDNLGQLLQLPELPLLALAIVGAVLAIRRRDLRIIAPLAWSLTGIVAVLLYQPLFPHHLLLLSPALALTSAIGFADLAAWRPAPGLAATTAVMLAAAIGLTVGFRAAQRVFIPNGHSAGLASAVDSMTDPGDFVISDNPFAVALADRNIPGPLVDTSAERITAGLLTVADLDAAREYYSVKVVLIDGDQLLGVPGFSDWLAAHYRLVRTIGRHTFVYAALHDND
jgi:4-amino-4-deoxy-L-arabinose transferase-like glycosyltransferase